MERLLQPELLDELPPDDPRAIASREDLRRVNWFMGNVRHLARALGSRKLRQPSVLELGAGDGTLLLKVARKIAPRWNTPIQLTLLDQQNLLSPASKAEFRALGWEASALQTRLQDWIESTDPRQYGAIVCNLFAHHFTDADLSRLFHAISKRTSLFVACEPWRNRFAPSACSLLWMLGCNEVTRHDAKISVEAGFTGSELTTLWQRAASRKFECSEDRAGLFSHLFLGEFSGTTEEDNRSK